MIGPLASPCSANPSRSPTFSHFGTLLGARDEERVPAEVVGVVDDQP